MNPMKKSDTQWKLEEMEVSFEENKINNSEEDFVDE
jgi:hypothetical protein